jgi:hypothetical protein
VSECHSKKSQDRWLVAPSWRDPVALHPKALFNFSLHANTTLNTTRTEITLGGAKTHHFNVCAPHRGAFLFQKDAGKW